MSKGSKIEDATAIPTNTLTSPRDLAQGDDFVKAKELALNKEPFVILDAHPMQSSFGDQVALTIEMVDKETGLPMQINDKKTGKPVPEHYTLTLRATPMREKYIEHFAQGGGHIGLCYVDQLPPRTPGQNPTWVIKDYSDLMAELYGPQKQGELPLEDAPK